MAGNELDLEIGRAATEQEKSQQWLAGVKAYKRDAGHAKGKECCIFTVPRSLKDLKGKKAVYEPQIVSLGPLHFLGNKDLEFMEKIKSEIMTQINNISGVLQKIKDNEISVRNCYDREKQLESVVLQWMMARDAYFILQFFRQPPFLTNTDNKYCKGVIENLPLMDVLKDIAKLENQVPLSVLKIILQIESGAEKPGDKPNEPENKQLEDILKVICKHMSPINSGNTFNLKEEKHILECLHSYVVGDADPSKHDQGKFNFFDFFVYYLFRAFLWNIYGIVNFCIWKREDDDQTILPPAVELQKAGVKFRPSVDGIGGIRFVEKRRTLYLPEMKVDIHTETIMRNIVAFELCSPAFKDEAPVTRYIHLMDQLVSTEEDVAVLRKSHIILDKLENDSKVTELWNSLTDSTAFRSYKPIDEATKGLKTYYQKRTTASLTLYNEFVGLHCSSPWQALALVATVTLLLITACTSKGGLRGMTSRGMTSSRTLSLAEVRGAFGVQVFIPPSLAEVRGPSGSKFSYRHQGGLRGPGFHTAIVQLARIQRTLVRLLPYGVTCTHGF